MVRVTQSEFSMRNTRYKVLALVKFMSTVVNVLI